MQNLNKHTYHIGGRSCRGCATTVKNKLSTVPGVTSVQVDFEKKEAEITSSEVIMADTLQGALKSTHYTIAELWAA